MGEKTNAYRGLTGKPEGMRPLQKSVSRWDDNIKTDVREIGGRGMDQNHQDRDLLQALVNTVINLRVP
jgi:hypothetical protein